MSSTKPEETGTAAAAALALAIAALGNSYKARGTTFFPEGRDAQLKSYFVPRPSTVSIRASMEQPVCRSVQELDEKLRAKWTNDGLPELAAMAPEFARVASVLREESREQPDELSPFLYPMF